MQTLDVESSRRTPEVPGREQIIGAELIRAQYGNMPGAFIGGAVTASFMAAVLYDKVPARAVVPWLIAVYVNCAIRIALWKWFLRANPTDADVPRWGRYAVISAAVAGVVWGATGIVLNIPGNFEDQIVVLLVTTGLAFTSTYLAAPYLPAFRAFVYPTFVLASVPFLLGGDLWRVLIGLATLASAPLMLLYGRRLWQALRASVDVRLQNLELVEELRAQKKAAEDANVAKSRFLAVASHDLRQPLHALELFVQALEDTPLPAHAHQLVGNVRRSVDSMEELFDALLDISRLDAGAVRARIETIPLAAVFERLAFEYAPVAKQKGLALQVMKTSVYVRSDPTLLARIVRNLVANAVRYTERGRVTIGCRRRGEQVSVEVWDTGPGIPAEKHAEIFQEFAQLLTSWNCEVLMAASGAEMLASLGGLRRLPDLIIAEGPAPGEGGTAVVETLRNEFNLDVPALLVSATAGSVEERDGLPVLHRPFHAGRLRTLINNLLHAPVARARRAS
jgi:signal transduction histidine kinase